MEKIKSYIEYCRDIIEDRLPLLEGKSLTDNMIVDRLIDEMRADGTATYSTDIAISYLQAWDYECGKHFDYLQDNFERVINPFNSPEEFHVSMISYGVEQLLIECQTVNKAGYEKIFLNKETIDKIIKESKTAEI